MDINTPNSAADQEAIDRLLKAQQHADKAVAASREKAEASLAAARIQSLEIARKADLRISSIHKQRSKKIKKRVQALIALNRAEKEDGESDQKRLGRAVMVLAGQLTGADPLSEEGA